MTRTQTIAALILITVICLGLSALLLPETADRAPAPEPLVAFPAAQVVRVEVSLPGGRTQRLDRTAPDQWSLDLPAEDGRTTWPASTERVRAFLRILDRLRAAPAGPASEPGERGPVVTITGELGDTATIELPAGSLGGRSLVRLTPGAAGDPQPGWFVTSDELSRLLGPNGMLPWIDARAFAGVTGQVVGVAVTTMGGAMSIERTGAAWRLTAPFAAPAEGALIDELVRQLQTLPIAGPSTRDEPSGPDATVITLTSQTRTANPDGAVSARTTTHTLRTIGPVGQSGQAPVVVVCSDGDGSAMWGPIAASIDAGRLTEIVRQPNFYISRRVSAAMPADVRSLSVSPEGADPVELTRTDTGWARDGAALPDAQAGAVDALVSLLTQTAAATAEPADAMPERATPLATITARGLGGLAIAEVRLGVATLPGQPADSTAHALLFSGGLARYYSPDAAVDAVRWVAELAR